MTTINQLIKFAEEKDISHDEPLNVYVSVGEAEETQAHSIEMDDDHGALWQCYAHQDEDGFQLLLQDIRERAKR